MFGNTLERDVKPYKRAENSISIPRSYQIGCQNVRRELKHWSHVV